MIEKQKGDTTVNMDVSWPADSTQARARVLTMQAKLYQWAATDLGRRFGDVFSLVYDLGFLVAAWSRVQGNKGGRAAGSEVMVGKSDLHVSFAEAFGFD